MPDFLDDFTQMPTTAQNGTVTVPNYVNTNRAGTTAEFYIKAGTPNFGEFNTTGYPIIQRVGETLTNGILRLKYGYTDIASVHIVLGDYRVVGQNYIELIHDNLTNSLRAARYPNEALVTNVSSGWADGYSMQLEVYGNYVVIKTLDANDAELHWAEGYLDVAIGNSIFFSGSSASKKLYELEKREITALFTHKFWNLGALPNDFTLPTSPPSATTQKREVRWVKNPFGINAFDGIDVLEGSFSTPGGTLRITHDDGVQLSVNGAVIHERSSFTTTPIVIGTIAAGTHSLKLIHTQAILPNLCLLEINEGAGWRVLEASSAPVLPPQPQPVFLIPEQKALLSGLSSSYENGKPQVLAGKAKLEDDISRIVHRTAKQNGWLTMSLTDSNLGTLAELVRLELEKDSNWWVGQKVPISVSSININFFGVTNIGGVTAKKDGSTIKLDIQYVEISTGTQVTTELVIRFGQGGGR